MLEDVTVERSQLVCPRCRVVHRAAGRSDAPPLFAGSVGGMTLHGCAACAGVFLGPACARRLAEAQPPEVVAHASRASAGARYQPDLAPPLACPACQQTMHRTHAISAQVEIDSCKLHGTWYDRGELERVAQAIRGSGWGGAVAPAVAGGPIAATPIHPHHQRRYEDRNEPTSAGAELAADIGSAIVVESVFSLVWGLLD
jgi:Zn-finger nucleic acid-binding protein